MSLAGLISTPAGKARYVRGLFATIADRYDVMTIVLSYGRDRRWKERLVELAHPAAYARALDLATGTGDIAFLLRKRGARVIGLDITRRMIELARAKAAPGAAPAFVMGDMMTLPFPSATFDIVTTGYGLRNVPELSVALDEIYRVLKTGGQALTLDFNRPANRVVRRVYLEYLRTVGGLLGWALHGDPDTYRYIAASLGVYPEAAAVSGMMKASGFSTVSSYRVLGGLLAIHRAVK